MTNRMTRMCPNKLYNYKYQYNDKLPIGKHKGKIVGTITETEPSYILWLYDKKLVSFSSGVLALATRLEAQNKIEREEKFAPWGEEDEYCTEDIYGRND